MELEIIRDSETIDKIINELEEKNANLKANLKDEGNKVLKLYLYAKIKKIYNPDEFGMKDEFGGILFKIAKLEDKKIFLLVNSFYQVLAIAKEKKEIEPELKNAETFGQKMARVRKEKEAKKKR